MSDRGHITRLLDRSASGDADASGELIAAVYGDLRRQAAALMSQEKPGHTLQPTVLVHDAFMQLIGLRHMTWVGRAHFFAMAARVMRRMLVDHARKRLSAGRGAGARPLSLHDGLGLTTSNDTDVLELHDALNVLESLDPRQAQVVALRFFGGLSMPEVAAVIGVSTRTAEGDWAMARAWLLREMAVS